MIKVLHFIEHLMCRPVLLNIIHFVLSTFIFNPLSAENFSRLCNIFVSPSLLSEIITRSSAHRILPEYCAAKCSTNFYLAFFIHVDILNQVEHFSSYTFLSEFLEKNIAWYAVKGLAKIYKARVK